MRVLRISSRFHPPHPWLRDSAHSETMKRYHAVGGMQLQVYLLTKALSDLGIHQEVITIKPPWTKAMESWGNIKVHRYGYRVPVHRQLYEIPALIGAIRIASRGFDIVHCHSAEDLAAIPIGLIAAKRANAPFVLTIHNSWNVTFQATNSQLSIRSMLGKYIEEIGLKNARRIIVLTNRTARLLIDQITIDSEKIEVIPDGIDLSLFASPIVPIELDRFARRYGIMEQVPKVTYIGRLHVQKGVVYLLHAMALLKDRGIKFQLIICGDGPEYSSLRKECDKLEIQEDVIFTGFIHHDDVPMIFKLSSVVVVPSIYEELGSVLLEAMASAKAIVASDVGGIPEVIHHLENAILVPPMDPLSLADKISLLLADVTLNFQLGQQAFYSSKKYNMTEIAKQIQQVYFSAMYQ